MPIHRLVSLCLAALALLGVVSCDALRDTEPFTVTITYEDAEEEGKLVVVGPKGDAAITGDAAFGQIQIVNDADEKHGFAIDELAVYETIPSSQTKTIEVQEARDNTTYTYYCHLHGRDEFTGTLTIKFVEEEAR